MLAWITVIILSMSPISELRGAIPSGVALGLDPFAVFVVAVFFNSLVFLPIYFGLEWTYSYFSRFGPVRKLVEGVRKRERGVIEKYGPIGLIVFVAIPLPVTGAWTGTLLAWLFHINPRIAWLMVIIGVCISGTIVLTLTLMGVEILT